MQKDATAHWAVRGTPTASGLRSWLDDHHVRLKVWFAKTSADHHLRGIRAFLAFVSAYNSRWAPARYRIAECLLACLRQHLLRKVQENTGELLIQMGDAEPYAGSLRSYAARLSYR